MIGAACRRGALMLKRRLDCKPEVAGSIPVRSTPDRVLRPRMSVAATNSEDPPPNGARPRRRIRASCHAMQTAKSEPLAAAVEDGFKRKIFQPEASALGRVSSGKASPLGLSYPPPTAFCPESQAAEKSPP